MSCLFTRLATKARKSSDNQNGQGEVARVAARQEDIGLCGIRFTLKPSSHLPKCFLSPAHFLSPCPLPGLVPTVLALIWVSLPHQFIFPMERSLKRNKQAKTDNNETPDSHSSCSVSDNKISRLPSAGKLTPPDTLLFGLPLTAPKSCL